MIIALLILLLCWYVINLWAKKAEADDKKKAKAKVAQMYEPLEECV